MTFSGVQFIEDAKEFYRQDAELRVQRFERLTFSDVVYLQSQRLQPAGYRTMRTVLRSDDFYCVQFIKDARTGLIAFVTFRVMPVTWETFPLCSSASVDDSKVGS